MLYHKLGEPSREGKVDDLCVTIHRDRRDARHAVHVPLHEMASQPVAGAQRSLEVDAPAYIPRSDGRSAERRCDRADGEPTVSMRHDGETGAVDRDAFALDEVVVAARDAELEAGRRARHCLDSVSYTHLTLPTSDLV